MTRVMLDEVHLDLAGTKALDGLTFEAMPGELLVLVGPSGSGKTTALRVIAGLQGVDSGTVRFDDADVTATPPDQRNVAMVFQSYALFPHMDVRTNLAFGLRIRKVPAAEVEKRIRSVADRLDIDHILHRMPSQMSGGERQRVALARALLRSPSLFLMDEPLSNLDAQLRVRSRAEIVRLHQELGTTLIYVTHDQVEALGIGHRVAVMDRGRIEQIGTPKDVYDMPANLFVATFIGSPAMNQIPARMEPGGTILWEGGSLSSGQALPEGDVVVGVRPEHVLIEGSSWSPLRPGLPRVEATVAVIEPAGDQQYLILDGWGTTIGARVEPSFQVPHHRKVVMGLDPSRLMIFDGRTGKRVR